MLKKIIVMVAILAATASAAFSADTPFTFGLLLVGPYNDHGWSQAHYEAGRYV